MYRVRTVVAKIMSVSQFIFGTINGTAQTIGGTKMNPCEPCVKMHGCPCSICEYKDYEVNDLDGDDPGYEIDADGYPVGNFEDCEG